MVSRFNKLRTSIGIIEINQTTLDTLSKALEQKDVKQWHDVAQDEYNSLIKNKTWTLTKLHPGSCKWVLYIKWMVKLTIQDPFNNKRLFPIPKL